MKNYILVMRDTRYWLVGPFASEDELTEFGRANYAPGGRDDPRWQAIELGNPYVAPQVMAPTVAKGFVVAGLDA